jgi:hypothetical protein
VGDTTGDTGSGPMVADVVMYSHLYSGGSKSIGSSITPSSSHNSHSLASRLQTKVGPASPTTFTDLVVNLNGQKQFTHFSKDGFDFPSSAALVEAERGNLDNVLYAKAAGVDLAALNVTPKSGYRNAYESAARSTLQPLNATTNATLSFLYSLSHFANVHFGLVAFNDTTGNAADSTFDAANISSLYPQGGSAAYPLPNISLNPNNDAKSTNYTSINTVLPTLNVWGERNTAQGLKAAIDQLTNHSRSTVNKAILLITNGTPNKDLTGASNATTATADALNQAARARSLGIPIYCVAVSQNSTDRINEDNLYSDTAQGIAAISGHGARYYRVDYSENAQTTLTSVLANVARQMSSLLK